MARLNRTELVLAEQEKWEDGLQKNQEKPHVVLVNGVAIPLSLT